MTKGLDKPELSQEAKHGLLKWYAIIQDYEWLKSLNKKDGGKE